MHSLWSEHNANAVEKVESMHSLWSEHNANASKQNVSLPLTRHTGTGHRKKVSFYSAVFIPDFP